MQEYLTTYSAKNPMTPPVLGALQARGSWHGRAQDVVSEPEYRRSEFYEGWARKHGVFHIVMACAGRSCQSCVVLSASRPERARLLEREAVELMGFLLPHLWRAFQAHSRLEALRASEAGAHASLESLEAAVIAVGAEGRVVTASRRAEAVLQRNDGLAVREGKLIATEPCEQARFEAVIHSAARAGTGPGLAGSRALLLRRSSVAQPLIITVMPFHPSRGETGMPPYALVFVSDLAERPASRAALLAALYRLTPAECRLADLMLEQCDLSTAAQHMGISIGSARFMLKTVFRKTTTRRQSQLIRLLMSLPAPEAHQRSSP